MSGNAPNLLRRSRGFSLVETIITVSVVAVLGSVATPSMTSFMTRHRVQDATTDLFVALLKARSQAIMLNSDVRVQPMGGNWAAGWQVPDPSNPGKYLDVHGPAEGVDIAMSGATSVTYQFNGRIRTGLGVKFNLSSGALGHVSSACVSVDPSGRPYTEEKPCVG